MDIYGNPHEAFHWYNETEEKWESKAKSATEDEMEYITELESKLYVYYPTTLTDNSNDEPKGIKENSPEWEMLIKSTVSPDNKTYWLASHCIGCDTTNAGFGVHDIKGGRVGAAPLFFTNDNSNGGGWCVRPVVSLETAIKLTGSGDNLGKPENMWQISK